MKKNMKKFMKVTAFLAVASMIQPVFGAVTIFNRSLPNQAGLGYDSVLDTWDYLTIPGLYSNLTSNAISFGFTNDGKLTNANSFFGGGRLTLGAPIYLVAGIRNENSVNNSGEGSTTTTQPAGTTTTNAFTKSVDLNNSFRVAAGTSFGNAGIQVFADLNASGISRDYTGQSDVAGATLKSATIEQRAGGTYDRYGINYGMKNGDMVVNIGVAMKASRGSEATFTSADGTLKTTLANQNNSLTAANAFPTVDATLVTNNADSGNSYLNQKSGLLVSSFGWMPMAILTPKDVVGWVVSYEASTMFGTKNFSVKHENGTNDNWTAELEAKTSGLGTVNINPYLTIPFSLGEAGNLYINIDLNAVIIGSTLETNPIISGKQTAGTDFSATEKASGFAGITAFGAGICASQSRRFCDNLKTEVSDMTFTLGLPLIAEINVNKSLVWILGTFPKISYKSYKSTTTITDLNDPKALDTIVSVNTADNGKISTAVDFTTGLKFKAAENFDVNLLATTGVNNNLDTTTFSVSANYIFK